MRLRATLVALALLLAAHAGAGAQSVDAIPVTDDLAPLLRELFGAIEGLSDYRAPQVLPPVFELPQYQLEAKVCDEPCNVRAAYVPGEGVFLAGNLDPARDPLARAALLHELVHVLQQGHPKFDRMTPCRREVAKEEEAYALQNAYLASLGRSERVEPYTGDLDCAGEAAGR